MVKNILIIDGIICLIDSDEEKEYLAVYSRLGLY